MEDLNPPQVNTSLDLSISSCQHHLSRTRETITGAAGDSIHSRGKERPTAKQEGVVGTEDFNRITSEHKKLTEMLVAMYENVHAMQNQLININNSNLETKPASRKRKFDCYNWSNAIQVDEKFANCDEDLYKRVNQNPKSKISRAFFPTDPSDMSLIVKDGYHWRKYGQKVTRDNPSPRAYFKCSFAPNCPVKKKVQRSVENPTILVATYEGVHNHRSPTQAMNGASSVLGTPNSPTIMPLKPSSFSSSPSGVLDSFQLFRVCRSSSASKRTPDPELSEVVSGAYLPQVLVQQMVSALTSDPNFTATLATAISGKILEDELRQDWGQEGK